MEQSRYQPVARVGTEGHQDAMEVFISYKRKWECSYAFILWWWGACLNLMREDIRHECERTCTLCKAEVIRMYANNPFGITSAILFPI